MRSCQYIQKFHITLSLSVIIFSHNNIVIAMINMYAYLKYDVIWTLYMEKIFSPILLVLILQFESQYLKNCKRYMSENLHKSRV